MTNSVSENEVIPAYLIRYSKRAKYISMSILPNEGLQVVLPSGRSERDAEKFIKEHQKWLVRHADLLHPDRLKFFIDRHTLPESITLRCLNQSYQIRYKKTSNKKVTWTEIAPRLLQCEGSIKDFRCCEKTFYDFLKLKAQEYLLPMMEVLSKETKLQYRKIYMRHQKTRWGSCTVKGDIYLNLELLFLPPELTRYLMIHELCHLKEFNHSSRFWKLVEKYEPNYERLKKRLRDIV